MLFFSNPSVNTNGSFDLPLSVTKFHKIMIQNIRVREQTSFKMVIFHKQRAITTESMVRYGPLPNLKKTSWYLTT